MNQLVDKYMGSAGNTLDPDEVRALFRPLGYTGPNATDYQEAEQLVVDAVFERMIQKALRAGKKDLAIVTGPPASGKSTAVRQLNLKKVGLVYDAALTGGDRLESVVKKAKELGMEKITIVPVYNDVLTSYKNCLNRGKSTWRYTALDYLVNSYRGNIGQLEQIIKTCPDVEIIPVDCSFNHGVQRVSIEDALKWSYSVTDEEIRQLFTCLKEELDADNIEASSILAASGDVLSIQTSDEANKVLAKDIDQKIQEVLKAYKLR